VLVKWDSAAISLDHLENVSPWEIELEISNDNMEDYHPDASASDDSAGTDGGYVSYPVWHGVPEGWSSCG
jgi:hypothetical protein